MNGQSLRSFEQLEVRRLLAVDATVGPGGDLLVTGEAEGAVEIVALDATTYQVVERDAAGDVVNTIEVEGITDDIRIHLDSGAAAFDDDVTLDLAGQAVDRVMVRLGDGDNVFRVQGGTIGGSLLYSGGDGDDILDVAGDVVIEQNLFARMGHGDDQVLIDAGAQIDRGVFAVLGDGDNAVSNGGEIGRSLLVSGRGGNDTVELLAGSTIGRTALLSLGGGDNSASIGGAVDGNVIYNGNEGNDDVEITEDATVDRNVLARLGGGENSFSHQGEISRNLVVFSSNAEDEARVDVEQGIVGGHTVLRFGRRFGFFGRFGFGPFGLFGLFR